MSPKYEPLILLFVSLTAAVVMTCINMVSGKSPILKFVSYVLIWVGVALAIVSLVVMAVRIL